MFHVIPLFPLFFGMAPLESHFFAHAPPPKSHQPPPYIIKNERSLKPKETATFHARKHFSWGLGRNWDENGQKKTICCLKVTFIWSLSGIVIDRLRHIEIQLTTIKFVGFIHQSLVLRPIVLGWNAIYRSWSISKLMRSVTYELRPDNALE